MTGYATAPVMIWHLAGRPRRPSLPAEPTPGVCAMCGRHTDETIPAKHTVAGKSFTDQYLLARPDSTRTCYACSWVCTGKGMDQVRMWTVVAREDTTLPPSNPKAQYATDHLHCTSRADMRAVADTLADPPDGPWIVAIAESGQRHTLPYSVINRGAGRWRVRMDARDIDATPDEFTTVFSHVLALRAAGHSADEIEHLNPSFTRLKTTEDLQRWQYHATALAAWRSAPLLHLAVFLPNKEHMDEYRDRYPAPEPGPGRAGSDRPGDPLPERHAGLGRRGDDRPQPLGPGAHRPGDSGSDRDTLF